MSKKVTVTICRGFGKTADDAKSDAWFKAECEGHDPSTLDREWFRCQNGNVGVRLYATYDAEEAANHPQLNKAEVA